MRYLLHGDDAVSSRKSLTDLTLGHAVVQLDGKTVSKKILEENILATSLFMEKKAVVIENLLSKNTKKKELVDFLLTQKDAILLVLWEDKKLPKTSTNSLKNVIIQEFALPTLYFQFLDSFTEKNGKKLFLLYQKLLNSLSAEQIYYSLVKRVRLLLIMSENGTTDDLAKMAPWQKSRLQQQMRQWSRSNLLEFYSELQNTEIKLKTGKLPLGLSKHLDTLILSRL